MSFYTMLHGVDQLAPVLLYCLEIKPDDVERIRDVYLQNGEIVIFTRTGGGNREDYPNEVLTSHPQYLRDEDDDFDPTYASYHFAYPEKHRELLEVLAEMVGDKESFQSRFEAVLARMEKS